MSTTSRLYFYFMATAYTEIYPLSLHDALPISPVDQPVRCCKIHRGSLVQHRDPMREASNQKAGSSLPLEPRSEEHTSELQSRLHLVCRLLLEKKKDNAVGFYWRRFTHAERVVR